MAQFDYKGFLKEGGIEKYLIEENFGNDIESRYQFIRPLMSRLPDSARTEMFIDGMEEARAEDDKMAFDYYFVEAMKELGLESELMEADSLINPEAEEIDPEDLAASADYFDSLSENDDVLDEMLDEDVPLGIAPPFAINDYVVFKDDWKKGSPMRVTGMRKMFASPLHAIKVTKLNGETAEYDETQLVKLMSPEEKANAFVREEVNEIFGFGKKIKYRPSASDASGNIGSSKQGTHKSAPEFEKSPLAGVLQKAVKKISDEANDKGFDVPRKMMGNMTKFVADGEKGVMDTYNSDHYSIYLNTDKEYPRFYAYLEQELLKDPQIKSALQTGVDDLFSSPKGVSILLAADKVMEEGQVSEVEGEVQTENKLLKASNTLEDALNKVVDDLTDEQIDKFTEMILDLRDKVKGLKEEKEATDVKTIDKLLPKINSKKEFVELLPKLISLDIVGLNNQTKKAMLLKIAKQLK